MDRKVMKNYQDVRKIENHAMWEAIKGIMEASVKKMRV